MYNIISGTLSSAALLGAGGGPSATGVLFDSSIGDSFVDKFISPVDAALTVSDDSMLFNHTAGTPKDLRCRLKGSDGNAFKHCFDHWKITARYTVRSLPFSTTATCCVLTGSQNDLSGGRYFGFRLRSLSGTILDRLFGDSVLNGSANGTLPSAAVTFVSGDQVDIIVERSGSNLNLTVSKVGGSTQVRNTTLGFAANAFELPRLFNDFSIQWMFADVTLASLKIEASYPNAAYALIGDSLVQGRFAAAYSDGWAQLLRSDYPEDVLACGAPSAKSSHWLESVPSIEAMNVGRAFIALGVNDLLGGDSLATFQANMTSLIAAVEAIGVPVVLLNIPPVGSGVVPTWNAWLETLGKPLIDIYNPLLGSGVSLNAAYNSGDNIHWNTAGNEVVYGAVADAITSNGW
jgi:lysophospholipase L1-like esterase